MRPSSGRFLASALLAAWLVPSGASAASNPAAEGFAAYQSGDYARAGRALREAADAGDSRAMNLLGEMHATGKGTPKDPAQALAWFKSAADKGDPDGENNLGELYASGLGAPQDPAEAAAWFKKAAAQGHILGSYNLGRLTAVGAGVPRDLAAAADALQTAVRAAPTEPRYRDWLGSVYCDQGRYAEALEQFSAVTLNGGKASDVWAYYQGMSLLGLGRLDEAREALTRALDEPPSHNRGVDRRAEAEAQLKNVEAEAARLAAAKAKEEKSSGLIIGVSASALAFVILVAVLRRRPKRGPVEAPDPSDALLAERYQLQEEIGAGGMGKVYAAYDHERGLRVAAKRIRTELKDDPDARKRFHDEARAVSKLIHPNIVGVQALVEHEGETIIFMDFIEGRPLSETLTERVQLPLSECRAVMRQVCSAVDYAHGNGVVHRDLKPSNIMLQSDGKALVMDFGVAREIKDALSHMTQTAVVGTLVYMAPEQHLGQVCRQSDVYALGVTLYEMLTGRRPFDGPDALSQKERLHYVKAGDLVPGLPRAVDELIASALAPRPGDRPQTAAAFAEALLNVA